MWQKKKTANYIGGDLRQIPDDKAKLLANYSLLFCVFV